jgi:predicted short-subunit dehydrogenase-like oxidoreductase (DUF2520 family)
VIERAGAPRLRVGVVGVGRVGSVLGAALARAGHTVVAAAGVSAESRRRADRLLPDVPLIPADEVVAAAELVLLSVPDDQLADLVHGLAAIHRWQPGQLVVHCSGAHGVAVLQPAAAAGAIALALHPIMTFTGRAEDLQRLEGIPFGVTAAPEFRPVAETLALELGGEPVWVPEHARPRYHAALAIGSNHLLTLVNDSVDVLAAAGIETPQRLLAPLVSASLDNALRLGDSALTGPISRGDVATVVTHIRALRQTPFLTCYLAMARRTVERAAGAGRLTAAQAQELVNGMDQAEQDNR